MPVRRFWIFWLQLSACELMHVRSRGCVETLSAMRRKVCSAASFASSLTATKSMAPPVAQPQSWQALLAEHSLQELDCQALTHPHHRMVTYRIAWTAGLPILPSHGIDSP